MINLKWFKKKKITESDLTLLSLINRSEEYITYQYNKEHLSLCAFFSLLVNYPDFAFYYDENLTDAEAQYYFGSENFPGIQSKKYLNFIEYLDKNSLLPEAHHIKSKKLTMRSILSDIARNEDLLNSLGLAKEESVQLLSIAFYALAKNSSSAIRAMSPSEAGKLALDYFHAKDRKNNSFKTKLFKFLSPFLILSVILILYVLFTF